MAHALQYDLLREGCARYRSKSWSTDRPASGASDAVEVGANTDTAAAVASLDHKGLMVTLGHRHPRTALVRMDRMGHMGRLRRVHKGPRPGRLHNRSQLGLAHMHWTVVLLHTAEKTVALLQFQFRPRWWAVCARWRRCISRAWGWRRRLGTRRLPRAGTPGRGENQSNNDGDDGTHGGFKEKRPPTDLGAVSLNFPVYAEPPRGSQILPLNPCWEVKPRT